MNTDPTGMPILLVDPDIQHAVAINREYLLAIECGRNAVAHAIECGKLLLDAKEDCLHGEWSEWIDTNFSGSLRTAQKFMRLANASSTTLLTGDNLTDALATISTPKQPKPPLAKPVGVVAVVRPRPQPTPQSVPLFKSRSTGVVLDAEMADTELGPLVVDGTKPEPEAELCATPNPWDVSRQIVKLLNQLDPNSDGPMGDIRACLMTRFGIATQNTKRKARA